MMAEHTRLNIVRAELGPRSIDEEAAAGSAGPEASFAFRRAAVEMGRLRPMAVAGGSSARTVPLPSLPSTRVLN